MSFVGKKRKREKFLEDFIENYQSGKFEEDFDEEVSIDFSSEKLPISSNALENNIETESAPKLKESSKVIEKRLLGISADKLSDEREDEDIFDKLEELQEFDFIKAICQNTNVEGIWTSLPTFSSELLKKKKPPLAYEIFCFIKRNFDILVSNEKNCLYVYNSNTGCYNEMNASRFSIFLSKILNTSDAMPFLTGTVQRTAFNFLLNDYSLQVKTAFFDNQERFINVANGVVDLTTGELLVHDPKYGFLTSLSFSYDKDYAFSDEVPKQFGEMLKQNFPDASDRLRFLQCLAYLISNRYSNKVAFYWLGKPHTGKSTYQRLLTGMVGENLVSNLPLRKLADKFSIATLAGKKLNFCSETGRLPIKNLDVFKALIGNDYIDAEFKGKDHFSFRAQTKCVFAGNSMLNIDSSIAEDAIFDRFEFIKFKHPTKKKNQIPFFEQKLLKEEGTQILSLLIRVLRQWYKDGCRFVKTDISKELKKNFKYISEEPDVIDNFVKDCCKLDSDANVSYSELFKVYIEYCKQNGCVALTQQAFVKQIIVQTGAEKRRLHPATNLQYRGLAGIRLKNSVQNSLMKR